MSARDPEVDERIDRLIDAVRATERTWATNGDRLMLQWAREDLRGYVAQLRRENEQLARDVQLWKDRHDALLERSGSAT